LRAVKKILVIIYKPNTAGISAQLILIFFAYSTFKSFLHLRDKHGAEGIKHQAL